MEEKKVKKINASTFATMLGAISAMTGFLVGLVIAVLASEIAFLFPNLTERTVILDILFGESAIIIFPIIGFILGFVEGLIIAIFYNYLAPRIGGIELSFE